MHRPHNLETGITGWNTRSESTPLGFPPRGLDTGGLARTPPGIAPDRASLPVSALAGQGIQELLLPGTGRGCSGGPAPVRLADVGTQPVRFFAKEYLRASGCWVLGARCLGC